MNRTRFIRSLLTIVLSFSLLCINSTPTHATTAGFKAGDIMDDAVMTNNRSMSVVQIQAFLNSKVPNCDTNGVQKSEYGGGTRAQWGKANYGQSTFTCLKDYRQNNKSSAQIIYDVAQKYSINPQTLIVLLQKEQGLVTDTWPLNIQYRSATGYGCPDTAPCDSQYYGLTNQLDWAAKMFRSIVDQNPNWYSPYFKGTNPIVYWHPDTGRCGSAGLKIENWSTASLYSYTPYRPNQAALNAGYGTGDSCSSYGNRNFYSYFTDWFGSVFFPQPSGGELYRQSSTGKIYLVANNKRFYIPSPSTMSHYNLSSFATTSATDSFINNITDGGALTNMVRDENGNIYLVDKGVKHKFNSPSICSQWGADCFNSNVVRSLGDSFIIGQLGDGSSLTDIAKVNATYYKINNGTKQPFADINSLTKAGYSINQAVNLSSENVNQPLGKLILSTAGIVRFSPKPEIYYFTGTEYLAVPDMGIYDAWDLTRQTSLSVPTSSYNSNDTVTTTKNLDYWAVTSAGDKYVVSDGNKVTMPSSVTSQWLSSKYEGGLDALLNKLPSNTVNEFIKTGDDMYKISPDGDKRYITSVSDYNELGGKSTNTVRINHTISNTISTGPYAFPDGRLLKVQGDPNIYVMSRGSLLYIPSMSTLHAYGFDTSRMRTFTKAAIDNYTVAGELTNIKLGNGYVFIHSGDLVLQFNPDQVKESGLQTDGMQLSTNQFATTRRSIAVTSLYRNKDNGKIYLAKDGALHYITSVSTLNKYSGPITAIDTSIESLFTIGTTAS